MKGMYKPDRKKRPVYSYAFKSALVDKIENGYLSLRFASIKYKVSRSTLDDWCKRYGTDPLRMDNKNKSLQKKAKEQQKRIDELELMLDIQREIIADFEIVTGKELAKKYLPKPLADAVEKIKRERLKSK
jgi:transposase-like protein